MSKSLKKIEVDVDFNKPDFVIVETYGPFDSELDYETLLGNVKKYRKLKSIQAKEKKYTNKEVQELFLY